MDKQKTALVLGATGGIGGEVARQLLAHGWRVRGLRRGAAAPQHDARIDWIAGDAMNREQVVAAAAGVQLVVHAVNPPGYRDWDKLVLPMIDNTIAAARASGARILLPGTVYNYGADAPQVLSEATPHRPTTRKGALREQMEQRLEQASQQGVPVLIVRAGDFFGGHAGNSWFGQCLVKPGRPVTAVNYPGPAGIGHSWAYLPDVANTMVRLVQQEARLGVFERFQFRGQVDVDGMRMIEAIRAAVGAPALPVRRLPWFVLRLLAPFVTLLREMVEMRYLWQRPFEMDNARLLRFLGSETHTPLEVAVADTLAALGCLPAPVAAGAGA